MTTHESIRIERRGSVIVVSMDDGKANALSSPTMNALRHALVEVASDESVAVVLAGREGFFSGGLNLKVMPTLAHDDRVAMVTDLGRLLLEVFLLQRPVVAAVGGHALAGGALLALACDVRLGVDVAKYRFGLNEVTIGLPLPTFGVEIARASIPLPALTEATLHGRVFSPSEAHARGVIESLHEPGGLLDAAVARAAGLATLRTSGYLATKQRLRGAAAEAVRATLDVEIEGFLRGFEAQ